MVPLLIERGSTLQKLNLHGCERVGQATIDAGAYPSAVPAPCPHGLTLGSERVRACVVDFAPLRIVLLYWHCACRGRGAANPLQLVLLCSPYTACNAACKMQHETRKTQPPTDAHDALLRCSWRLRLRCSRQALRIVALARAE